LQRERGARGGGGRPAQHRQAEDPQEAEYGQAPVI